MLDRSLHPLLQEIENWGESSWRSEYSRQQRAAESHGPAAFSIEPPAPHIRRHKVQSACRKYIPGYDKSPPCEELFERFPEAEERAIALNKWHASRSTDSPSTNAHDLVAKIRSYRRF